jgi:hypothetical protein
LTADLSEHPAITASDIAAQLTIRALIRQLSSLELYGIFGRNLLFYKSPSSMVLCIAKYTIIAPRWSEVV